MKLDQQDQNEVLRRVKASLEGKRDPVQDLEKATTQAHDLGKKFRGSASKDGSFSQPAADQYARALREVTLCEVVLAQYENQREVA